jgi:hypothetical protein
MKYVYPELWRPGTPFVETKEGRVYGAFPIPAPNPCSLKIRVLSTDSTVKQGVVVAVFGGKFVGAVARHKSVVVWYDHEPWLVHLNFKPSRKSPELARLSVWNVWDGGDGKLREWGGNAAMRIESTSDPSRWIAHCSRGQSELDFSSLVLDIEMTSPIEPCPEAEA